MEYFHSEGGNNRPDFPHRFKVRDVTDDMVKWCSDYDSQGRSFRRWHIVWGSIHGLTYDIVQFEWETAALLFSLKFGDYVV